MIKNYRSSFVWKYFMKNKYVQNGMKKTGIKSVEKKGGPIALNVVVDGIPPVEGQILSERHDYYSPKGINEDKSDFGKMISLKLRYILL